MRNHNDYMTLKTLHEAWSQFNQTSAQKVLDTEVRDLFERYDLGNVFGIGLMHRHFDMDEDEILVEHGTTSTPWPVPSEPNNYMGGRIVPRSWRLDVADGQPHPYEFRFEEHEAKESSTRNTDPSGCPEFLAQLQTMLRSHGLESFLGLVAVAPTLLATFNTHTIQYEKTFGRANVVFDVHDEDLNGKDTFTAVWTFEMGVHEGRKSMICWSRCVCD